MITAWYRESRNHLNKTCLTRQVSGKISKSKHIGPRSKLISEKIICFSTHSKITPKNLSATYPGSQKRKVEKHLNNLQFSLSSVKPIVLDSTKMTLHKKVNPQESFWVKTTAVYFIFPKVILIILKTFGEIFVNWEK